MMPFFMQSRTPFSTEGMKLRGHGAAEDLVDELEAAAAREGLDAEPGVAVLAAAARLLLVLALHLGAPLDRLLVGDARRQQRDVDVVLALHALHHHLDVELAHAGDQQLLGLGIEVVVDGGVLLGDAGSAVEILSSSPRVLGWMAKLMAGSGNVIRGSSKGCASSQSVSPVWVSLSLGTTPISPGPSASTVFWVLPMSQAIGPCARGRRAPD